VPSCKYDHKQGLFCRQIGHYKDKAIKKIHWQATLLHPDNRDKLSTAIYYSQKKTRSILNIIALDTSGSTLVSEQLSKTKAVVQSLCQFFYQKRQRIALLSFGNQQYQWLITDSKAPANIDALLASIQAGGGTPLREALLEVERYIAKRKQSKPMEKRKFFLISDVRSRDNVDDIALIETEVWVLDSENSEIRLNKAQALAMHWKANYLRLF